MEDRNGRSGAGHGGSPGIGVDGCRRGWVWAAIDGTRFEHGFDPTLSAVVARFDVDVPIFVDMPIGLPSDRPRRCDRDARRLLAPSRSSSVFPVPSRAAALAPDRETASRRNHEVLGRGLSVQSWALVPKILEVDRLLRDQPALRGRVREAHPELCFRGLHGAPMADPKRTDRGFAARLAVLEKVCAGAADAVRRAVETLASSRVRPDDVVDATVLAICASRVESCRSLPDEPEFDDRGLRMEIVFWPRADGIGEPAGTTDRPGR